MSRRWYDPLESEVASFRDPEVGHAGDPPAAGESPRAAAPTSLGEVLRAVVSQRGWRQRMRGARIHTVWEEIAGPELARQAEPVRLHGGVLVLRVASPAWATQVRYLAGDLVERANAVLGEAQVKRVTVVTGRPVQGGGRAKP